MSDEICDDLAAVVADMSLPSTPPPCISGIVRPKAMRASRMGRPTSPGQTRRTWGRRIHFPADYLVDSWDDDNDIAEHDRGVLRRSPRIIGPPGGGTVFMFAPAHPLSTSSSSAFAPFRRHQCETKES